METISVLLTSEYRLIYFLLKTQWNRVIVQEISYNQREKVKKTFKDKLKKFF